MPRTGKFMRKKMADVMTLKISKWRDYPGFPGEALNAVASVPVTEQLREISLPATSPNTHEKARAKDWSDAATNQGEMPVATRSWRRRGRILS